jgi:hypothetical protein
MTACRWQDVSPMLEAYATQNAYIESFNGRLRDECLNEHWFTSVAHAQIVIETWRREYNEERPKKGLGGLTPAAYAKQLMKETSKVTAGLQADRYSRRGDVSAATPPVSTAVLLRFACRRQPRRSAESVAR